MHNKKLAKLDLRLPCMLNLNLNVSQNPQSNSRERPENLISFLSLTIEEYPTSAPISSLKKIMEPNEFAAMRMNGNGYYLFTPFRAGELKEKLLFHMTKIIRGGNFIKIFHFGSY